MATRGAIVKSYVSSIDFPCWRIVRDFDNKYSLNYEDWEDNEFVCHSIKIKTSKFSLVRKIQLYIIKKLLGV